MLSERVQIMEQRMAFDTDREIFVGKRKSTECVLPHRIRREPLRDIPDNVQPYRTGRGE